MERSDRAVEVQRNVCFNQGKGRYVDQPHTGDLRQCPRCRAYFCHACRKEHREVCTGTNLSYLGDEPF